MERPDSLMTRSFMDILISAWMRLAGTDCDSLADMEGVCMNAPATDIKGVVG